MGYRLRYTVNVDYVPDGVGPMSVACAQTIGFSATVPVANVPGGNTPTLANFNTALSGSAAAPTAPSLSADISGQINAALAQIQGFATGGG